MEEYLKQLEKHLSKEVTTYYDQAKYRMLKIGAKAFNPKQIRETNNPINVTFNWRDFHTRQQRRLKDIAENKQLSIEELTKKIAEKLANDHPTYKDLDHSEKQHYINMKLAKSLLYKDWKWKNVKNNEFEKFLVNSTSGKKIKISYREVDNKLIVSANKKDMQDPNVVAIMLELSREAQRMSNKFDKPVQVSGLSEHDNPDDTKIINNINSLAGTLNEGVAKAKKIEDKSKKFEIKINPREK